LDLDLNSGSGIAVGLWHHVALAFERTGQNTGTLRLYTNGVLAATSPSITWALEQTKPLVFGGHNSSSSKFERSWNGRLADLVLFTNSLSAQEISRLATRSVARFGGLTGTNTVTLTVIPPNTAPSLAAVSNCSINAGFTLVITNIASDPEVPPQVLSFCLLSAPTNATLNSSNGIFTWRPLVAQANSSNWITIQVSDNGMPPLSATQSFWVKVLPVSRPSLSLPLWQDSQFVLTVNGDAGLDYTIQASPDLTEPGNWQTLFSTSSPPLPFTWADTNTGDSTQRFYRILLGP